MFLFLINLYDYFFALEFLDLFLREFLRKSFFYEYSENFLGIYSFLLKSSLCFALVFLLIAYALFSFFLVLVRKLFFIEKSSPEDTNGQTLAIKKQKYSFPLACKSTFFRKRRQSDFTTSHSFLFLRKVRNFPPAFSFFGKAMLQLLLIVSFFYFLAYFLDLYFSDYLKENYFSGTPSILQSLLGKGNTPIEKIFVLFSIFMFFAVIPAFTEEFFFRGILQNFLTKSAYAFYRKDTSPLLIIFFVSFCFSFLHSHLLLFTLFSFF